jgi:hypothetical protein
MFFKTSVIMRESYWSSSVSINTSVEESSVGTSHDGDKDGNALKLKSKVMIKEIPKKPIYLRVLFEDIVILTAFMVIFGGFGVEREER